MNERSILPAGGDGLSAPRPGEGPAATQAAVVVDRRPDAICITVTGELDLATADGVEQQILGAIDADVDAVTVDLSGLRYIDSAGLWILFRLGTRLAEAGIAGEVVVPVDGPVWRMVETAGVTHAIPVRPRPR